MRSFTAAATLMFVLLPAAGCVARVEHTATVSNQEYGPEMVYAAPGVQVIVDYDEPIFYADSFYWRFYGGGWYRSPHHNGGWVYATPPAGVRGIGRPQAYVHYRPVGWTGHHERVYQQQPVRGQPAPQVYRQPPRAAEQQAQQPHVPQQQWQQPARVPQQQWQQPSRGSQQQWQQQPRAPQQQWQQPPHGAPGPKGHDHHDDQGSHEHHGDGDHHDHH